MYRNSVWSSAFQRCSFVAIALLGCVGALIHLMPRDTSGNPDRFGRVPIRVCVIVMDQPENQVDPTVYSAISRCGLFICDLLWVEDVPLMISQYDVVVVPGGSATQFRSALGPAGRDILRRHISNGAGYVGICAGAFLAMNHPEFGLGMLGASPLDSRSLVDGWGEVSMLGRRAGFVRVELTEAGRKIFSEKYSTMPLVFIGGPVVDMECIDPSVTSLATYTSELWSFEFQRKTMIDTSAILISQYGNGKVIAIGPHPELSSDLGCILCEAVWAVVPRWSE